MKSYKKEMMNTQCKNTNEKKTLSTNSNGRGSSRASNGKVMAVEADIFVAIIIYYFAAVLPISVMTS